MSAPFRIIFLLLTIHSTLAGQSEPKVVATASMIADMVKEIAGDKVDLSCIVPIGGDPHVYEPTPGDAAMVAQADLVLRNGLTFEGWLNELIENVGSNAQVVTVTDGLDPIGSDIYENAFDPHAWMDVNRGLTYIKNITSALQTLDPSNAKRYATNHTRYAKELTELDTYIMAQIATIPKERRILITSHDAFQYYGRRYGLQLESVLGTSTDADVQTSDIMRLNKVIAANKVPAVFIESTINPKLLQQLAKDNDIRIGGSLYADSLGDEDGPAGSYLNMLKYNTDVIVAALTRQVETDHTTQSSPLDYPGKWMYALIGLALVAVGIIAYFKFAS